jgi:N-acetylglucosamine kinase-like BadF-type ATPase
VPAIGIDIGGSKTHAVLSDGTGRVIAETTAGSANFESVPRAAALAELDSVFDALGRTGIDAICVGSAGINTAEQVQDLTTVIAQRVPGAEVTVVHDTRLILATAGLDSGIAVISGTGSVAWGRATDGRTARSGGWGYLLGDEGGGYGLVRDAVRHALGCCDAGRPDRLSRELARAAGVPEPYDLMGHFYAQSSRRYWAGLSRLIFQLMAEGDEAGTSLVDATADALVKLVVAVADRIGEPGPVALGGGLIVHQPVLQQKVRDALAVTGILDVRPLTREPVHGAVRLALDTTRRKPAVT